MPDVLSSLASVPGLGWIAFAAFVSGLVRGFTGFGTALVFLPVAAQFLPPFAAIITLTFMDLLSPLPVLKPAWRDADRGDLKRLLIGTIITLPVGLSVLAMVPRDVFRFGVSGLSIAMLAVLVFGIRYRGEVKSAMVYGIGAASGFLGGTAGLPGPPVILFYMARPLPTQMIRANTLLFLFGYDLMIMLALEVFGRMQLEWAVLGLLMGIPGMLGNWLGGRLFRPGLETLYRAAAYAVIAASAVSGLPIWS
ncbi:MAG: sulfite exporter TauE/SafE family protein [Pelagimonas sp.]|uniref:sulfite exporter TauE/SafE family protein n=1 Tax=Pelagimonas sp. TaxID=2073170 RepID=UPI003D6ABEBB